MFEISFDEFEPISNILCLLVSAGIVTFLVLGVGEAKLLEPSPISGDIQHLQSDKLYELCRLERFQQSVFLEFFVANSSAVRNHDGK
jgi:hypothetical protein